MMQKLSLLCLTAGLLAGVASAQTALYVDNAGFELPATSKISGGWDVSGANNVPGWMDAGTPNNDSGIENPSSHQHSGTWNAYAMGGQPGAYQITTNTMSYGKKYTLTWWGSESWNNSVERTSLIRADATNTAFASCTELAVTAPTMSQDYSYNQYSVVYISGNADAGKYIGIAFRNTGPGNSCWGNWDDFTLTEEDASPSELMPAITTQPVGASVYEGDSVTFTANATGPDLVYQWQAGVQGSGIYTNISGATGKSLTISWAMLANTADYVVTVTNSSGSVTSDVAQLTVTAATYANGLFNGDFELPAMNGITSGFDMPGKDVPGWKNAGPNQNDSGMENSGSGHTGSYAAKTQKGQSGTYQITTNVLHLGDSITMTWWSRNAWQGLTSKVSLLSASSQQDVFGSTTTLISQTNVLDPNDYNWYSHSITYTVGAGDAGKLLGIFWGSADTTTGGWGDFDDFSIVIAPPTAAPTIVTQPASQTAWLASTATFSVVASGSGLTYQWQAGTVGGGVYTNISNGGQFSGADTATLTIANVAVTNNLDYVVIITNTGGSITSDPATLTVNTDAPYMGALVSKTVFQYDTTTIAPPWTSGATTYQWQAGAVGSGIYTNLSNDGHFSGVNTANLTITSVAMEDGLDYVLVASNAGGTSTNGPATLTVTPVIYVQPFNTADTNDISVVGWVHSGGSGGLSSGGWPNTCVIASGNTNVPQAFYVTTFTENGSIPNQMAFPVINLTNVTDLTFSMDYDSYWGATSTHTYFAVQMNWGAWYIQASEVPQANGPQQTATVTFDPTAGAWNQFTVSGAGTNADSPTATVIGSAATNDLTGYVTGAAMVSLHDDTASSAWVKMDNFRITASTYTAVSGLSLAPSGSNVTLSWGYGTLVESASVTGPWTPVSAATSPKTVTPADGTHFYRLQLP